MISGFEILGTFKIGGHGNIKGSLLVRRHFGGYIVKFEGGEICRDKYLSEEQMKRLCHSFKALDFDPSIIGGVEGLELDAMVSLGCLVTLQGLKIDLTPDDYSKFRDGIRFLMEGSE